MKKSTMVLLIVGASAVVLGILLCVLGMGLSSVGSSQGFDFVSLGEGMMVRNEYEISEAFSDLELSVDTTDIEILPATDGVTRVVCQENQREPHEVSVENGTLKIGVTSVPWYHKIQWFSFGEREITVYLAETELGSLSIRNSTGDVEVAKEFSFARASVTTSTGDVEFGAAVAEKLSVQVDTGDVSLVGARADEIEVTSSTGDQTYESVVCRTLVAKSSTGEQEYSSVDCRTLTVTSSTGNQEYRSVTVAEKMTLKATTGDVSIFDCSAAEVSVETSTGDVEGRFAGEMIFFAKTDTGKVRVPKSTVGGSCEITTDTGNIEFSEP